MNPAKKTLVIGPGAFLVLALSIAEASAESPAIEVDKARGEVRFPCRFVNPTRLLEVFACHHSGPTHETVLEFDVTGPAIYKALLAIGCRPSSFWNGTSPDDFQKNQGDRILVLVRWELGGERFEPAAEGMLTEGETGFPAPVRGFSFGARGAFNLEPAAPEKEGAPGAEDESPGGLEGPPTENAEESKRVAEEVRATGMPVGVEISLGALLRQTQPHTLLSHPTSSVHVQSWMLPPVLDSRIVKDQRQLIEKQTPATLILRRIRSELALVEIARATAERRGIAGAGAAYARIEPLAREVDALKGAYEALLASLQSLVDPSKEPKEASDEEKGRLAVKVKGLIQRGQWLCAKMEERYLSMYAIEEELKAEWVTKQTTLPEEVREEATILVRDGFRFEPILAAKQVELAALDLDAGDSAGGERGLKRKLISAEIDVIGLDRSVALSKANTRSIEARIASLKDTDPYVKRLFEEDLHRSRVATKMYSARRRIAQTEVEEIRALLDGSWDGARERVLGERKAAQLELERAQLEDKLVDVEEEIRWTEGDLESEDPSRRAEATAKLKELQGKKLELQKQKK